MKKILYSLVLVIFFSTYTQAQDTINAIQAKKYIGKKVMVCDRVSFGRYLTEAKDQPDILWIGQNESAAYLFLVFPKQNLQRFSFDPEKKMVNKRFCLKGTVTKFRGKPAIYVTSESQLNVED